MPDAFTRKLEIEVRPGRRARRRALIDVLARDAKAQGAAAAQNMPRARRDDAISAGLELPTLRQVVEAAAGGCTARPAEAPSIAYCANSIATC